jgi:hypothetical protein
MRVRCTPDCFGATLLRSGLNIALAVMRVFFLFVSSLVALSVHAATSDEWLSQLAEAKAKWSERGSDHYTFVITDGCFCLHPAYVGPLKVTVRKNRAEYPIYAGKSGRIYYKGKTVVMQTHLRTTIPDLFMLAENLLKDRHEDSSFRLEFDPNDGHPTRIYSEDPMLSDSQTDITVESFKHL